MGLIGREDHQKLYLQLYDILKKKIENGEWAVGSQIPTEEELCKMFSVSRATVRTAVLELVRLGYLKRQQGKGTFIFRNSVAAGLTMSTRFRESMLEEEGGHPTQVLARTVMMPVDSLDRKLDIAKDKHVIYIKRLHIIANEPVMLQEAFVPYHVCPLLLEEDAEHSALSELLEKKYGIRITKVKTHIDIAYITPDEARILELKEGSAAVLLEQYFYSGDTLVMHCRCMARTDRSRLFISLDRNP